jgi:hypothetical protein
MPTASGKIPVIGRTPDMKRLWVKYPALAPSIPTRRKIK